MPAELRRILNVINQYLETPYDVEGKKAEALLNKQSRRRKRPPVPVAADSDASEDGDDEGSEKKPKKSKPPQKPAKSAEFIQDSEEEYGDMEAFLEREAARRRAATSAGGVAGPSMKKTGTKKRRKKANDAGRKRRKTSPDADADGSPPRSTSPLQRRVAGHEKEDDRSSASDGEGNSDSIRLLPRRPRPRPRPQPVTQNHAPSPKNGDDRVPEGDSPRRNSSARPFDEAPSPKGVKGPKHDAASESDKSDGERVAAPGLLNLKKGRKRLVLSDDDA